MRYYYNGNTTNTSTMIMYSTTFNESNTLNENELISTKNFTATEHDHSNQDFCISSNYFVFSVFTFIIPLKGKGRRLVMMLEDIGC